MSGNSVASYACEMEMWLIVEMCLCVCVKAGHGRCVAKCVRQSYIPH